MFKRDMFRQNCGYPLVFVFIVSLLLTPNCIAWKPIISANAFTTTYSLKQSHPDLGAKSSDSGEASSSASSSLSLTSLYPEHDARILTGAGIVNTHEELSSTSVPVAFKFDDSDNYGYGHSGSLLSSSVFEQKHCPVKKFAFNHDGTVDYEHHLPQLTQFTMCFWSRFTNHTGDHTLLTYSDKKDPRALQIWVANAMNSSFISMAIKGQQVYRLNYPLKLRQWHHTCSSWNGKTGEWQVWMKAERIGRGFHNALVGYKLPANARLFSGGPSVTAEVSQGLHFEITFVQIYRIALSAGKAHRNHKHHHVHHVDHEGQELSTTTKPPPVINRPQSMSVLLANGQIPTRVKINLAQPAQAVAAQVSAAQSRKPIQFGFMAPQSIQDATIQTSFVNGQINTGSRLVAQQLIGIQGSLGIQPQLAQPSMGDGSNIQFVDETETRIFFKRQAQTSENSTRSAKVAKAAEPALNSGKNVKKRELVILNDGVIVDNAQHGLDASFTFDGLAGFGGQQFKDDLNARMSIEEEVSANDHEPAEEEVRAVMTLCSACDPEPFQGAIVFAWKDVVESMDNVLKGNSVGGCASF